MKGNYDSEKVFYIVDHNFIYNDLQLCSSKKKKNHFFYKNSIKACKMESKCIEVNSVEELRNYAYS